MTGDEMKKKVIKLINKDLRYCKKRRENAIRDGNLVVENIEDERIELLKELKWDVEDL